jgi:hypothetical protein
MGRLLRTAVPDLLVAALVPATQAYFTSTFGRLRSVVKVPGANAIWISTSNTTGDKLLRSVIQ